MDITPSLAASRSPTPTEHAPTTSEAFYTYPMHLEVQQNHPGDCPKCGMPLELKTVTAGTDEEEISELRDMTRRCWIAAALTLPVFVLAMAHVLPNAPHWVMGEASRWTQFALPTPVVLWAGGPSVRRGWRSVMTRHQNMFKPIAIVLGAAFVVSAVAMLAPNFFPQSMQPEGKVAIYYEAAVIVVMVLRGQGLELRARSRTGSAIKALLNFTPPTARQVTPGATTQAVPGITNTLRLRKAKL